VHYILNKVSYICNKKYVTKTYINCHVIWWFSCEQFSSLHVYVPLQVGCDRELWTVADCVPDHPSLFSNMMWPGQPLAVKQCWSVSMVTKQFILWHLHNKNVTETQYFQYLHKTLETMTV